MSADLGADGGVVEGKWVGGKCDRGDWDRVSVSFVSPFPGFDLGCYSSVLLDYFYLFISILFHDTFPLPLLHEPLCPFRPTSRQKSLPKKPHTNLLGFLLHTANGMAQHHSSTPAHPQTPSCEPIFPSLPPPLLMYRSSPLLRTGNLSPSSTTESPTL